METMTKNEFKTFASIHGCDASYSGKTRKFYLKKLVKINPSILHGLINAR